MTKLQNKKAIVTGANRSIGKAIALAFAKEGADVVISYRSDEKGAKKTVESIQELGCLGKAVHADFSHLNDVEPFFKEALDFLGHVDILVNNASGYNASPFLELRIDTFESLLRVGVSAPFMLSQLVANQMIKTKTKGSIINISAISGTRPYPNRVAHSTAKAALNMLTQNIALDLARFGIRVNAIAPGTTPYDGIADENMMDIIPLQRIGTPEDQANTAVFLASERSSWITGQILSVDGGQSLSF